MQSSNQTDIFQNQLSIQIDNTDCSESDVDNSCESSPQSTPCKSPTEQRDFSNESSFCDAEFQPKSTQLNKVFSTPIQFNKITSNSTPLLSHSNQSLISIVKRKPLVNFHSIEDIVYGGTSFNSSNNDSGISQSFNSNQSKFTNESEESTEQNDDKENQTKSTGKNDKKFRTTFTDEQKKMLDIYFSQNPYPDPKETEDMSLHLGLPENVIKVWFQNKRSRDKQRKFSRENNARRVEVAQQPNSVQQNFTQSPLIANLQFLSNQIKAAVAFSALRNINNF